MINHQTNGKNIADCVLSLMNAIQEAGGSVSLEKLKSITLMDFIVNIAGNNHIRFAFLPPGRDERDADSMDSVNLPRINRPVVLFRRPTAQWASMSNIYLHIGLWTKPSWTINVDEATRFANTTDAIEVYKTIADYPGLNNRTGGYYSEDVCTEPAPSPTKE